MPLAGAGVRSGGELHGYLAAFAEGLPDRALEGLARGVVPGGPERAGTGAEVVSWLRGAAERDPAAGPQGRDGAWPDLVLRAAGAAFGLAVTVVGPDGGRTAVTAGAVPVTLVRLGDDHWDAVTRTGGADPAPVKPLAGAAEVSWAGFRLYRPAGKGPRLSYKGLDKPIAPADAVVMEALLRAKGQPCTKDELMARARLHERALTKRLSRLQTKLKGLGFEVSIEGTRGELGVRLQPGVPGDAAARALAGFGLSLTMTGRKGLLGHGQGQAELHAGQAAVLKALAAAGGQVESEDLRRSAGLAELGLARHVTRLRNALVRAGFSGGISGNTESGFCLFARRSLAAWQELGAGPDVAGVLDQASTELIHRAGHTALAPDQAELLAALIRSRGEPGISRRLAVGYGKYVTDQLRMRLAEVPGVRLGDVAGGGCVLVPGDVLVVGQRAWPGRRPGRGWRVRGSGSGVRAGGAGRGGAGPAGPAVGRARHWPGQSDDSSADGPGGQRRGVVRTVAGTAAAWEARLDGGPEGGSEGGLGGWLGGRLGQWFGGWLGGRLGQWFGGWLGGRLGQWFGGRRGGWRGGVRVVVGVG